MNTHTNSTTVQTITDAYLEIPEALWEAINSGYPAVDAALDELADTLRAELTENGELVEGVESSERIDAAEAAVLEAVAS